jgi:hypothetical protein
MHVKITKSAQAQNRKSNILKNQTIMTHPVQTSSLFNKSRLYSNRYYCGNLYQVVVNTEEGESYEYEVEADTFAEATKQAENYAMDLMVDITYIECYAM